MATAPSPSQTAPAVLYGIDWGTYTRLLKVLQTRRRFRLTYDRGTLEIMSPLFEHEAPAYVLGMMIDTITEEFDIPKRGGRTVTLRRRKKQRGLEPDNCFWIANTPRLQGKLHLDLRVDPPPDLAIEVEITSRVIKRMDIYAVLGVPEVWVLSARGLEFKVLKDGTYQFQSNSLSFPYLTAADLHPFLAQLGQIDDTSLIKNFREWVRRKLKSRPTGS